MRMILEMRVAGRVLHATVRGDLELKRARPLYRQVLDESARAGATSILMDCRGLRGLLSPMQRYELGVHVHDRHVQILESGAVPPRVVIVAEPPLFDRALLMESVAVNRGARFRAVETLEEAAHLLDIHLSAGYPAP